MPSGLLSRREFLASIFAAPALAPSVNPVTPSVSPKLLPGIAAPEFWFGETSGQHHTERGEICGASWNHPEAQWEYAVTWLNSTAYPSSEYPIFDGNLISADVLSRVRNAHQ